MRSGPNPWRLLLPKWLALHVFVVAACIAMVLLGQWQWSVAHRRHGAIQNYAYAFQWWAFVGFAILMWFRVVRDYLAKADDAVVEVAQTLVEQAAGPRYVGYVAPRAVTDDDPERARFNAYLAELADTDRQREEQR